MDRELESLELKISKFLRAGVLVAGALMAAGWLAAALRGAVDVRALQTYAATPLADDLRGSLARGDYFRLVTYAGLAVLIALPFTRVVLTAVLFVKRRELVLAAAAAFVSLALVASVALGIDL